VSSRNQSDTSLRDRLGSLHLLQSIEWRRWKGSRGPSQVVKVLL